VSNFLLGGARFKLNFTSRGNTSLFANYAEQLQGRWVALVPAENDRHLSTSPAPSAEQDRIDAKYVIDHSEEMTHAEVYEEGRGDEYENDCAVIALLRSELDDADAVGDGRINTTRVRELLTHFEEKHHV